MQFFQNESAISEPTYNDPDETTVNPVDVPLDGEGRLTLNVFGSVLYTVKKFNSDDVQKGSNDNVRPRGSPDVVVGQFDLWDSATIYDLDDKVKGSDGLSYNSLVSGNINNDPTTSTGEWELIGFVKGSVTTALISSDAVATAGDKITSSGFYTAGDGGGGEWIATGNTIAVSQTPSLTGTATCSNANGDEYQLMPTVGTIVPVIDIRQVGAKVDSVTDDTAAVNAAIQSAGSVFVSSGNVRIYGELSLKSNVEIYGVIGASQLWQYGQYLFKQNIADLENVHIHDLLLDFKSTSTSRYDSAFNMGAYRNCVIENLRFIRYDDQTIMERAPDNTATYNGVDNIHRNWSISACAHVDIAIGLEGYYFKFTGNASDTVITTDIVWPELFNSSVVVVEENNNRIFTQLELTTDYTVSYDGDDKLIITMIAAPTADTRIHIWPAQPRADGNRRPYSNNLWENINCDYIFVRGHTVVRWVDAEDYVYNRMTAAADYVKLYDLNPFNERNGQGGDFMNWTGCVLTYQYALVVTPSTLVGIDFGPGSVFNTGIGVRGDLLWVHSGFNKLIGVTDAQSVVLTGTITTDGTAVIIGSGTKFRDELTHIGAVPDVVVIDGTKRGIVSIDSDTQLTLSSNAPALAGIPITRYNFQNSVSYDMSFGASGSAQTNTNNKSIAHYIYNSNQVEIGEATIVTGDTFVDVPFRLARVPLKGEIRVDAFSVIGTRSYSISTVDADSFRINIDTAGSSDFTFGWRIELMSMN